MFVSVMSPSSRCLNIELSHYPQFLLKVLFSSEKEENKNSLRNLYFGESLHSDFHHPFPRNKYKATSKKPLTLFNC